MVRKSITFEAPKLEPKIDDSDFETADPEDLFDEEFDSLRDD